MKIGFEGKKCPAGGTTEVTDEARLYYYTNNRSFPRNFSPFLSLTWWLWGKRGPG